MDKNTGRFYADHNGSIDDNVTCHNLTVTFYEHLLWTTAAEFLGNHTIQAHLATFVHFPPGAPLPPFSRVLLASLPCMCLSHTGIIVTLVIIELIGCKVTRATEFFGTAVFFALTLICAGR